MAQVKHKYDYDAFLKGENSASYILNMVDHGAKVLEIGAGQGGITKHLTGSLGCEVSAVEVDADSLAILEDYCESVYSLDLNDPSWPESIKDASKFDTVLAADVLEHLKDPQAVLMNMKSMVQPEGYVIVSLPHIGHNAIHGCLLEEDFAYSEWGLLDNTHIRFFGIKNMQDLFDVAGLKIVDVKFVLRQPEDTELAYLWGKVDKGFKGLLNKNKFGHVYQCVIKATPSGSVKESLKIIDMDVGVADNSITRKLNRITKKYLPASFYQQIRNIYQKINN